MPRADRATSSVADEVAGRILSSAKYRHLDPVLVRRVAGEAAERFTIRSQAEKYAKRKLHQASGAFVSGAPANAVRGAVAAVRSGTADVREAARSAMRAHASSAERLDWLAPFYGQVAEWCGQARSVADLGCGLNPLATPWMSLAPGASYWACDVDRLLVAALAELGEIMPVRPEVCACDLVASPPELTADVALLLKTVATLEQQATGAAGRVLRKLDCRHVIVSFARRSLSGRRGYSDDAWASVGRLIEGSSYDMSGEASFGDEIVFHLESRRLAAADGLSAG
jgi:16S rRNA (guanine(1405)-N(7))-methyltransferase